jgi:hypothetical protein
MATPSWEQCSASACEGASVHNGYCYYHLRDQDERLEVMRNQAARGGTVDLRGNTIEAGVLDAFRQTLAKIDEIRELRLSDADIKVEFDLHGLKVGTLDCTETRFSEAARFSGLRIGEASFFRARFERVARFGQIDFQGEPSFREAEFVQSLFIGLEPEGPVSFHDGLEMVGARFEGPFIAGNLSGTGKFDLSAATFASQLALPGIRVEGDLVMSNVTFDGDLSLTNALVSGTLSCVNSRFAGQVMLEGLGANHATFRRSVFTQALDLGMVGVRGWFVLDETRFERRVRLRALASVIHMNRAALPSGASLELSGDVVLDGCSFDRPSDLGQAPVPTGNAATEKGRALGPGEAFLTTAPPYGGGPRVLSVRGAQVSDFAISGADLRLCLFRGAHGLSRLRLGVGISFDRPPGFPWTVRETIAEERICRVPPRRRRRVGNGGLRLGGWTAPEPPDWFRAGVPPDAPQTLALVPFGAPARYMVASQVAGIYRELRGAREDSKDSPGAADFYYGEMEMRRLALTASGGRRSGPLARVFDRIVLGTYWFLTGYGLRAWRSLAALLVIVLIGAAVVARVGYNDPIDFGVATRFAISSATSLLRPPPSGPGLTAWGFSTAIALKLLGPALLAVTLLAVRARVKR